MKTNQAEMVAATELHTKLATINPLDVPVMSQDRHISRKDQAKLARQLFRQLGLKGISVTAPNYSMARSVDVRMPKREDYTLNAYGQVDDYSTDPAGKANTEAKQRIASILIAAFPKHDDRSEWGTDHYDYKWSIN